MITFDEARQIVERELRAKWQPWQGTLITLPTGAEDATHWRVIAGARESLVDGDLDFDLMDAPALLVSKTTGELQRVVVIADMERLSAMTPVASAGR